MPENQYEDLEPLDIRCTSSDCENGLHCFRQTRKMAQANVSGSGGLNGLGGQCRSCGAKLVDWSRVYKRDLSDVGYTFTALKYELVRHHFWHIEIDQKAVNHARRKGTVGMRIAAEKRLRDTAASACVMQCDIEKDQLPDAASSVVIVDPPWYEESMQAFLWAAGHLCAIGGHVLVSVPAVGTRPGIDQEWAKLLSWAQKTGLTLIRVESAVLPYISPPFERNALRTEGLYTAPTQWRRGNLAVFSHTHHTATERPIVGVCPWLEQKVGIGM